jgi:phosphoserine phosphatase
VIVNDVGASDRFAAHSARNGAGYYPVVVFDLDGTLLTGTSVLRLLAEHLGHADEVTELDRAISAGEISSQEIAERSAAWFAGCTTSEMDAVLSTGPWIGRIDDTLQALTAAGTHVLLATITWRFAAEMLRERHGFAAVSGTELQIDAGVLSGKVTRPFDEHDKLQFVEDWCAAAGFTLEQVAAVGDSRSDLPLFGVVLTDLSPAAI